MKNEIWKDIKDYEGLYQVSNIGRVKSLGNTSTKIERILKTVKQSNGYLYVSLCKDRKIKNHRVHRLVAESFIPNPNNYACINHKDECKTNNCVENIEWCSYKYNNNYGTRNKRLSKSLINNDSFSKKVICVGTNKEYLSAHEANRQTGINISNIIQCCKGKRKSAGGYTWKYSE